MALRSSQVHVPAWKKLGLKLAYARDEPVIAKEKVEIESETKGTKKRKLDSDQGQDAREDVSQGVNGISKKHKVKKAETDGGETLPKQKKKKQKGHLEISPIGQDDDQSEVLTTTPAKPSKSERKALRKSVSFTPETKIEDGEGVKQIYRKWVDGLLQEDPDFDVSKLGPALKWAGKAGEQKLGANGVEKGDDGVQVGMEVAEDVRQNGKEKKEKKKVRETNGDGAMSPTPKPEEGKDRKKKKKKTKVIKSNGDNEGILNSAPSDTAMSPTVTKVTNDGNSEPKTEDYVTSSAQQISKDSTSLSTDDTAKKPKKKKTKGNSTTTQTTSQPAYLTYLTTYHTSPTTWKFSKPHQNHILKNLFSIDNIPSSYDAALASYLKGLNGAQARERIRTEALSVRASDDDWLKTSKPTPSPPPQSKTSSSETTSAANMDTESDSARQVRRLAEYNAEIARYILKLNARATELEKAEWQSSPEKARQDERLRKRKRAELVLWSIGEEEIPEIAKRQAEADDERRKKQDAAAAAAAAAASASTTRSLKPNGTVNGTRAPSFTTNNGPPQAHQVQENTGPKKKVRKRKKRVNHDSSSSSSSSEDSSSSDDSDSDSDDAETPVKKPSSTSMLGTEEKKMNGTVSDSQTSSSGSDSSNDEDTNSETDSDESSRSDDASD